MGKTQWDRLQAESRKHALWDQFENLAAAMAQDAPDLVWRGMERLGTLTGTKPLVQQWDQEFERLASTHAQWPPLRMAQYVRQRYTVPSVMVPYLRILARKVKRRVLMRKAREAKGRSGGCED